MSKLSLKSAEEDVITAGEALFMFRDLRQEVTVLAQLDHPFIVSLLGWYPIQCSRKFSKVKIFIRFLTLKCLNYTHTICTLINFYFRFFFCEAYENLGPFENFRY